MVLSAYTDANETGTAEDVTVTAAAIGLTVSRAEFACWSTPLFLCKTGKVPRVRPDSNTCDDGEERCDEEAKYSWAHDGLFVLSLGDEDASDLRQAGYSTASFILYLYSAQLRLRQLFGRPFSVSVTYTCQKSHSASMAHYPY